MSDNQLRADGLPAVTFVYGALRSGTTVFRLMLDAHAGLSNPGEVDFLFDHLRRGADGTWRYDRAGLALDRIFHARGLGAPEGLDGLDLLAHFLRGLDARSTGRLTLNVHRNVDRIIEVMPDAAFIHLVRDPRDVANSSIPMGWAGNAYFGVDHWVKTEAAWERSAPALAGRRVHEMRYEALFRDIETELRAVCAFLDVPYEPAMLDYHRNSTYGPPDPKLIEQWRRKSSPRDVGLVEAKCGPLLAARGYAPGGAPVTPGLAERARLRLQDRLYRWRFAVERFGLGLFLAEKLAAAVGPAERHARLRRRMNQIDAARLR